MKKSIYLFLLFTFFTTIINAQTGKPRYLIRTERADTTLGFLKIELFPIIAPLHSAYFDSLVNIQFYDSTAIHRVVPDFVIQGGDPNSRHGPRDTWGLGDSTQKNIPAEFTGVAHKRGIIGAARDEDINSANSQFFVNVVDNLFLNYNYTAYGKVVEGMDLVDFIVNVPRDENDNPIEKISMFITKLDTNYYVPENPVLLSPENGTEGSTGFQKIEWNEVEDAVLYDVEVATDSNFTDLFYKDSVGSTTFTLSDLELGQKKYYWRIRANNGGFKSGFSEARYFVTSIDAPQHFSPENGSTDITVPTELKWHPVNGAEYYRLRIATVPTFSSSAIVFDSTNISDTTLIVSNLDENTKYYWTIRGYTATYEGPRSIVWSFTTAQVTAVENHGNLPEEFALQQNYPNPFGENITSDNPTTTIKYSIPASATNANISTESQSVKLVVYDILGRVVKTLVNANQAPGEYSVTFNAKSVLGNLPSGIYIYKLTWNNRSIIKKMVLLR